VYQSNEQANQAYQEIAMLIIKTPNTVVLSVRMIVRAAAKAAQAKQAVVNGFVDDSL
jgi:hypothetical protein